jgi:guanylate kinase
VHYNFTDREGFEKGIAAGHFLEHAEVHGNFYGTSKQAVQDTLAAGKVAVLDVDVQGARSIREAGLPALLVFVAPPSLEELERRLQGRGTETPVSMGKRIQNAKQEISALNERGLFDYLLLNDNLDESAAELERIAQRAIEGLPAEPGKVPDEVRFEDDGMEYPGAVGSNAAAAAAAGAAAAELLSPSSTSFSFTSGLPPQSDQASGAQPAAQWQSLHEPAGRRLNPASPTGAEQPPQHFDYAQQSQQLGPCGAAAAANVAAGLGAWQGKVALVTGASSGIGWAVCEALGRAGLRVVAVARRRQRLQELQQVVLSQAVGMAPSDFLPVVCDVTKEAEVAALPKIILKHWPDAGVDVLVNNAGLSR